MKRCVVVTTCNGEQWTQYGRAMASTFYRHWPEDIPLWLYAERFAPAPDCGAGMVWDLEDESTWLAGFKQEYGEPQYRGGANGSYDFRRDAVRFSHKVAAICAAAEAAVCDVLIWIDADTVTFDAVTAEWLEELFPPQAAMAWLDRCGTYPECGILMFRLPEALETIRALGETYRSGRLFAMRETHDSFVIQQVVKAAGIPVASLSGHQGRNASHHPWVNSRLGERMDHLKGARKDLGRSKPEDLTYGRSEPYWRDGARR